MYFIVFLKTIHFQQILKEKVMFCQSFSIVDDVWKYWIFFFNLNIFLIQIWKYIVYQGVADWFPLHHDDQDSE